MTTRSVYQPTQWTVPNGSLSIQNTSGWTLPLVMSLCHNDNFSDMTMTIYPLRTASERHGFNNGLCYFIRSNILILLSFIFNRRLSQREIWDEEHRDDCIYSEGRPRQFECTARVSVYYCTWQECILPATAAKCFHLPTDSPPVDSLIAMRWCHVYLLNSFQCCVRIGGFSLHSGGLFNWNMLLLLLL